MITCTEIRRLTCAELIDFLRLFCYIGKEHAVNTRRKTKEVKLMNKKLNIAVVGCGGIANCCHFPAYEKMDNVNIVAVCDIIHERALKAAKQFGLSEDKAFTDFREMLKLDGIEAVDICTPNYLHSIVAVEALGLGLHVFCEKPDAVSVAECEKMKAAAEKSGKTLMVMRNNRFRETSKFMKKYIEDGKMGEIYAGHCGWIRRRGIPGKGGWFTTKELSGGGPLIDLGVHMIDLAIWLMGNPTPVSVTGCTYSKFADNTGEADSEHSKFGDVKEDGIFDVEDLAMGFIRFDNGACLTIDFSWATNIEKEQHFVKLRGTKAGSDFRDEDNFRIFTEENGIMVDLEPKVPEGIQHHEANLRHFADVVLNGKEPMFTPIQGLNMIKILEALYKSAETGKEIAL